MPTGLRATMWLLSFALLSAGLAPVTLAAQPATPVGRWRTFDDKTGLERGLVAIEPQGGALIGRIVGTTDPQEAARVCQECKGARRNQPILGLTILTGMRPDGDGWSGGEILDPETGSVYRCSMQLSGDGVRLTVRGYLGVSLFGRSQTWLRQPG